MKRNRVDNPRKPKRPKVQQSVRNMFLNIGPKFVEAVGVQPTCGYCGRKFKAPQGLTVHIHMHERSGDVLMEKSPNRSPAVLSDRTPPPSVIEDMKVPVISHSSVENEAPAQCVRGSPAPPARGIMTRRFTLAEKLRIVQKYNETENLSGTCR